MRTVFGDCLSVGIEQIHPNILLGMGKHRFVVKQSDSILDSRLTFDDRSHQPDIPPISKDTWVVVTPYIATDFLSSQV